MKIQIGSIVKATHKIDNKNSKHPFLIFYISDKYIYGIQITSVKENNGSGNKLKKLILGELYDKTKEENNKSYFSENNIKYYEFQFSNLDHKSHIRLDQIQRIKFENIEELICQANHHEYLQICTYLKNLRWENNESWNNNQIMDLLEKGIQNFNKEYEI